MSATAAPPTRRARLVPRYSLRLLLLAFTAIAIGLALWFRPYKEETKFYYFELPNGEPDTSRPFGRRIDTWQRRWDGSRVKHGPAEQFANNDVAPWFRHSFRDGKQHGPEVCSHDGYTFASNYEGGLQHGVATVYRSDGSIVYSTMWSRGELHGDAEQHVSAGRVRRYRFAHGRVTHCDGMPINDPLFEKLARGEIDAVTARALAETNQSIEVRDLPFDEFRFLNVTIADAQATQRWVEQPFFPLGIDTASAIVLLSRAAGCRCDYRNGCIWVTPDVGNPNWRDPTGVADIAPPPDSVLAKAWQANVLFDRTFKQRPLAECLKAVAEPLGVEIDTLHVEPSPEKPDGYPVTAWIPYLHLPRDLTKLLYQAGCRCELRGETLVILPQETGKVPHGGGTSLVDGPD